MLSGPQSRPNRRRGRARMTLRGPLTAKLLVWSLFDMSRRDGATVGVVARRLRTVGLLRAPQPTARHFVRSIVGRWMKTRGSHRALERLSSGRYRAIFTDR